MIRRHQPWASFVGTAVIWSLLIVGAIAVAISGSAQITAQAQGTRPNDPLYGEQWALQIVGAACAWEHTTGHASVTVAVLDSGVDFTHPDLVDRLRDDGYDFVDNDNDPSDENGHGTHVTGIIVATLDNAEGIAGLSPNVQVLPVRVLNAEGGTNDPVGSIANGITYATEKGANVINLSLGMTFMGNEDAISPDIAAAIEAAQQQDVLIVIASGNSFVPLPNVVASNNPDVMVVAASNESDSVTRFSNTGPWIDVIAPGEHIYSTMPTYEVFMTSTAVSPLERLSQDYDYMSGTSMATPYVSALAALLFSAHPDWSADQVQAAIKSNAFAGVYGNHPDVYQRLQLLGAGRIDACTALEANPPVARQPAVATATAAPATTTPSPTSAEAPPATVQVVQAFIAALQENDITAANTLIDPSRPEVLVGPPTYLDFYPHLEFLHDVEYTVTMQRNNRAQVEVTYTSGIARSRTLLFTVSLIDGDWYIYDYELPMPAR